MFVHKSVTIEIYNLTTKLQALYINGKSYDLLIAGGRQIFTIQSGKITIAWRNEYQYEMQNDMLFAESCEVLKFKLY